MDHQLNKIGKEKKNRISSQNASLTHCCIFTTLTQFFLLIRRPGRVGLCSDATAQGCWVVSELSTWTNRCCLRCDYCIFQHGWPQDKTTYGGPGPYWWERFLNNSYTWVNIFLKYFIRVLGFILCLIVHPAPTVILVGPTDWTYKILGMI